MIREVSDGIATQQLAVLRMTHRMRVSPHPEGLLVEFDNQKAIAAAGDMTDALGAACRHGGFHESSVSPDGHVLRIEQTDRIQELVGQMYEPLAKGNHRAVSGSIERALDDHGVWRRPAIAGAG